VVRRPAQRHCCYGVTGLTEIMAHLVECRVKRVVLMLDADEAGRAAASDMAQWLAAVNIETRFVELPVKDAAEFIAGGGLIDELLRLITANAESAATDASAARAVRAKASEAAALSGAMMQLETSNDGACCLPAMVVSIEYAACHRWVSKD